MHANMSSRPFQLLTTLDWNEWVWNEFQDPSPDKSKLFCSHLVGDLVLLVKILGHGVLIMCINLWLGFYNDGLWVAGNFSPHTILGLVWDTGQTESSFQLGECQAARVNSFPLVWRTTPCPLPHKSSGPQVFTLLLESKMAVHWCHGPLEEKKGRPSYSQSRPRVIL